MAFGQYYQQKGGTLYDRLSSSIPGNLEKNYLCHHSDSYTGSYNYDSYYGFRNSYPFKDSTSVMRSHGNYQDSHRNYPQPDYGCTYARPHLSSTYKRRKFSETEWANSGSCNYGDFVSSNGPINSSILSSFGGPNTRIQASTTGKRGRLELDNDDDSVLMSKEEIERCSPSRKDGIDALGEAHLRYSYCAFMQSLGMRLEVPQTTIGTAMVLCHRFFLRRSHACHDRFLIASAALFLAAKSEETARSLNNVLRASCEIIHRQDLSVLTYMFPIGWYEQYRERVLEAEQLILTTLNFELEVQHPYDPLTSILSKVGPSQTVLVNLALNLVSEGKSAEDFALGCCFLSWLRSSLWLQFKPQHIAAGAVYLAAKLLNVNLNSCQHIWHELQAPQRVLNEVSEQLRELF